MLSQFFVRRESRDYSDLIFRVFDDEKKRFRKFSLNRICRKKAMARRTRDEQMEWIRMEILQMQYRSWHINALKSFQALAYGSCFPVPSRIFDAILRKMSDEIWSNNHNLQLHAAIQIDKLLSIVRECPTTLVQKGFIGRLLSFLGGDDFFDLQCAAAWALIKIGCATCGERKKKFVLETVPCFVRLLASPCDSLCEMAVFALGIVACESCNRDIVLINEALVPLRELLEKHAALENDANLSMLRNVTWTLSILYTDISYDHLEQVKPALTILERLLHSDDLEVLINSCWAIHGVASGLIGEIDVLMDAGLCPKLVEHLLHSSRKVQIPVVTAVALITFKIGHTHIGLAHIQDLIDKGILGHLRILLKEGPKAEDPIEGDTRIKRQACKAIYGILNGEESQIQAAIDAVINADLLDPLVKLLESPNEILQTEAARAISRVTSHGSRKQVKHLVDECKMINPICNLLSSQSQFAVEAALQVLDDLLEAENPLGRSVDDGDCYRPYVPYDDPCDVPIPKLIVEAQCMEKLEGIKQWPLESELVCEIIEQAGHLSKMLSKFKSRAISITGEDGSD